MKNEVSEVRVGTAGWAIARGQAATFPGEGSHLERYSRVFPCVEINSSFYRPHRVATYQRWAAAVPEGFRFAAKVPKTITHECGLRPAAETMRRFLDEVGGLGERLGPLLFQLPPKQVFDEGLTRGLLTMFREMCPEGMAAVEPRHASWFGAEAEAVLREFRMARVRADPVVGGTAGEQPGGWPGLVYYRLHGAPRVYYSAYAGEFLDEVAGELRRAAAGGAEVWCVLDNTALGAATGDALRVLARV